MAFGVQPGGGSNAPSVVEGGANATSTGGGSALAEAAGASTGAV